MLELDGLEESQEKDSTTTQSKKKSYIKKPEEVKVASSGFFCLNFYLIFSLKRVSKFFTQAFFTRVLERVMI